MNYRTIFQVTAVGLCLACSAFAVEDPGAAITRPAGYQPVAGDARLGEKLFKDTRLSRNGLSCASCHAGLGAFSNSFAQAYPHAVAMARDRLARPLVHLDEMIQGCMVMPMAARPLPWASRELAGLTAFLSQLQTSFQHSHPLYQP